jgi:hypothetical protein
MSNSSAFSGLFCGALFATFLALTVSVASAGDAPATGLQSASAGRVQGAPAKPSRPKRLTLPPKAPRYKCEDGECVCKGVLDCKSLIDSGFCKGKEFWQDGDDPSVGGCG